MKKLLIFSVLIIQGLILIGQNEKMPLDFNQDNIKTMAYRINNSLWYDRGDSLRAVYDSLAALRLEIPFTDSLGTYTPGYGIADIVNGILKVDTSEVATSYDLGLKADAANPVFTGTVFYSTTDTLAKLSDVRTIVNAYSGDLSYSDTTDGTGFIETQYEADQKFNFSNAELIPFANALGTGFEYDTVFYYEPSGRTFYSGYRIKVRGIQGGTDGVADASYSAIQFIDNDEDIIADIETLSTNGNLRFGTRVSGSVIQFIDPLHISSGTLTLPSGASVNNIQTTIGNSDVAVPTSGAVVDYVAANGSGDFSYSDTTSGPLVTDYQLDTAKINLRSEIATSIGDLAYADTTSGTGFIETQYRTDTAKQAIRGEIAAIVTSGSTAGSGIEFVGDSINLNGELTQATDLTWDGNSHIFRIKTKSGVGSNSRRIQADTNEGLLLEYYSNNNYSGDYGSVHAGSSTTAHPGMTYKPDTSSTTRYLTIRDSGIVTNHSVYFTDDSIYFQSQDIGAEWGYVRIDPNTGAMVLDTLITSAGAMLTEKLPRPGKLLSDRKDGEIKWPSIIKDGKVIWTYGIEPDQGRINTAHMGMIEANLRYTYRNTVKANISLGLNFAALIFVVVFLIWMYRKVY